MLRDLHSCFTNDELAELKRVYAAACKELGIDLSADHGPLRERVASLVMELARQGVCDSETIKALVVSQVNVVGQVDNTGSVPHPSVHQADPENQWGTGRLSSGRCP
jgi:hypothetical protein